MIYQNFKEYQQSDEYALHLLNSSDGVWQYHPIINFGNGTWYRVTGNYEPHPRQTWGIYSVIIHSEIVYLISDWPDLFYEYTLRWRAIDHAEFQTRLSILNGTKDEIQKLQ